MRASRTALRSALAAASLTAALLAAAPAAGAATDAELLRRHAPVLVLDAREPGPPVAVDRFLRGARGARAQRGRPRVYGHAVAGGGRRWLQYWLFYPDNPQDRGILRSGRHEGDWELLQVGLGKRDIPEAVTFAQHSWRQGCGWLQVTRRGSHPVAYVAHASHATYPRPGRHDRPWPDPNDEARGDGRRVRPAVTVVTDTRPTWIASPMRWGASRAAWWNPAEQSSPHGPRFAEEGQWVTPAAYHADAIACAAGPPAHPWWLIGSLLGGATLALMTYGLRRQRARAC